MNPLKYTLIADGSSDSILLNIIKWTLDDLYPKLPNEGKFADFRWFPNPPKKLEDKIQKAHTHYPFDILFIHRDAESTSWDILEERKKEITKIMVPSQKEITICVIPIKMMETWLLIDAEAIKKAAGNRYAGDIRLPVVKRLEELKQPKETLQELLRVASGLKGRNLDKFNVHHAVHLVADYTDNFAILRNLKAFQTFEMDLKAVMAQLGHGL